MWTPRCSFSHDVHFHTTPVISCHIISYHVISCHIVSYHITPCQIIPYQIISYHISCHVMSSHIISYHIMSYHTMSYHIMSCHIHAYLFSCMNKPKSCIHSFIRSFVAWSVFVVRSFALASLHCFVHSFGDVSLPHPLAHSLTH
jgi:hypothetical protein